MNGILSEVLKNSAAVRSSDTIPTGEVDEFHYVVFYLLYVFFNCSGQHFVSGAEGIGILQGFQSEFR